MVNLPSEVTKVLHDQLVLDMNWAVRHAKGGETECKSYGFSTFVQLALCTSKGSGRMTKKGELFLTMVVAYQYFDNKIIASNVEFVYILDAPKTYCVNDDGLKQICAVIVMTREENVRYKKWPKWSAKAEARAIDWFP